MIVQKMIIQAAVKLLSKQFKLDKILKYVEEPNELDDEVKRLRNRVELLEAIIKEK
jgi:transposase